MYQIEAMIFHAMRYGWTRVSVEVNVTNNNDMIEWARNIATNFWYTAMDPKTLVSPGTIRRFYFQNEEDAMGFKLRWTG